MAKNLSSNTQTNSIMEKLLASQSKKIIHLYRNLEIEGTILSKSDKELVLDLGAKAEGVLQSRELTDEQREKLKTGDKLKVFVVIPENEYGQAVVSTHVVQAKQSSSYGRGRGINWGKFVQVQNQKSRLSGRVVEINKGGLIVESDGVRGFLPNSQVGFELLKKASEGMDKLLDQTLSVIVIEVDPDNNKLIFSQRGQTSEEVLQKLKTFKVNQKVKAKIVTILPFGLVVDVEGLEGLVFISDVSWEKVEDLSQQFKTGDSVEVLVQGIDEELGRLNLSIKQLMEDPFTKLAEIYPADEVIRAEVVSVTDAGVVFKLEQGISGASLQVEGLLPSSKMEAAQTYEVGKSMQVLIDSVDVQRRRINLAPFITSTAGLIYK